MIDANGGVIRGINIQPLLRKMASNGTLIKRNMAIIKINAAKFLKSIAPILYRIRTSYTEKPSINPIIEPNTNTNMKE